MMSGKQVRKLAAALAVVVGVVGVGVFGVAAQASTPTAPTGPDTSQAQGGGMMMGRGPMMGGLLDVGPTGNLADSPIVSAIAGALKLDAQTLVTDLQAGKTVKELATAQTVELQAVYDAVIGKEKERLDAEVTTGYLTQAQADARLKNLTDNIANFPLFNQNGFGPGNQNDRGFGMMNGQGFGPGNQDDHGFGPMNGHDGGFGPMNGNGPWGNQRGGGPRGPWGNQQGGQQGQQGNQPNAPQATPQSGGTSS